MNTALCILPKEKGGEEPMSPVNELWEATRGADIHQLESDDGGTLSEDLSVKGYSC